MNLDAFAVIASYFDICCDVELVKRLLGKCSEREWDYVYKYWIKNSIVETLRDEYFEKQMVNGKLHSLDGPAVVCLKQPRDVWRTSFLRYTPGLSEWYYNGVLHREDGPAIEDLHGNKEWYLNGKQHRGDGPALTYSNGMVCWFSNGDLHREDGPAMEYKETKYWYIRGKRHRVGKPALVSNIEKEWYFNGKRHREDGPARILAYGINSSVSWSLNGKSHREDGPAHTSAVIMKWLRNGKLDREDGPAYIYGSRKMWCKAGFLVKRKIKRKGRTITTYEDGVRSWYINDAVHCGFLLNENDKYTVDPNEYGCESIRWYKNGLNHRERGPAVIHGDGKMEWYFNGKIHRDDGPAVIFPNGTLHWYKHGRIHREDGPAVIRYDGIEKWYIEGNLTVKEEVEKLYGKTRSGKTQWRVFKKSKVPKDFSEDLFSEPKPNTEPNLNATFNSDNIYSILDEEN